MGKVIKDIKMLSQNAMNAFTLRGLIDKPIVKDRINSSIFNLNIFNQIYKKLLEAKVICLSRGKGPRIAFHFYNTEDDLNH